MSIIREFAKFIEPTGELEYDNTTSGLSATTIKSAIDELNTLLGGGNVGSQATFSIYEFAASGGQTTFNLSSTFTVGGDVTAGDFITNETYKIQTTGTTDFTSIGALDSNPGTVFTATGPGTGTGTARVAVTYIPGYIQVYINGVFIASTDYTASDGQTVVLTEAAEASDLVTVVVLDSFNVATQLRVINVDASAPDDSLVIDNVGDVSVTSDIKLADNGKLILGDSSDLQIYHDGSNSRLVDSGTGNFIIQAGQFRVNTADDAEAMIKADVDGAVSLYHSGDLRLATSASGVSVTGTVTADGLTVANTSVIAGDFDGGTAATYIRLQDDTDNFLFGSSNSLGSFVIKNETADAFRMSVANTGDISFYEDTGTTPKLFWDASAERLGIGTASPTQPLNVLVPDNSGIQIESAAGHKGYLFFGDEASNTVGRVGYDHATDAMGFWTASVEHVVIDSSGSVGIGTSTLGSVLSIEDTADKAYITQTNSQSAQTLKIGNAYSILGTTLGSYGAIDADAGLLLGTGGTERMRIDSAGNVTIKSGLVNGGGVLNLENTDSAVNGHDWGSVNFISNDSSTSASGIRASIVGTSTSFNGDGNLVFSTAPSNGVNTEAMRIDASGNLGLGTSANESGYKLDVRGWGQFEHPSGDCVVAIRTGNNTGSSFLYFGDQDSVNPAYVGYDHTSNSMSFKAGGSLAMTIDSSGNLLVGKTTSNLGVAGVELRAGTSYFTNSAASPMAINRESTDGQLIGFYNDETPAGDISVSGDTVSYNAFMGSHYSETVDTGILFGTVMEVTGELVDQNYAIQERLSKVKVSDTAESKNVYGVWIGGYDGGGETVAALGASWCRIASGVTLELGDLLVSNGDGTAKVQSDDIIRSMTIGKVTSVTVKETHTDGSFVIPVVLYCG